jgi:hypothetical protein
VKTPARFHTDQFCSLFRALRASRIKKIAENFALLGQSQKFAVFSHGLDPELPFKIGPVNGREARESGLSAEGVGFADSGCSSRVQRTA